MEQWREYNSKFPKHRQIPPCCRMMLMRAIMVLLLCPRVFIKFPVQASYSTPPKLRKGCWEDNEMVYSRSQASDTIDHVFQPVGTRKETPSGTSREASCMAPVKQSGKEKNPTSKSAPSVTSASMGTGTTKDGKPRQWTKWSSEMNEHIIRCFYGGYSTLAKQCIANPYMNNLNPGTQK